MWYLLLTFFKLFRLVEAYSSIFLTRASCHKITHADGYYSAWPGWAVSVNVLPLTECYAMIAKIINIPSDFHKSIFWMIILFLIIIHSYHQDYVDGKDDADRMGHPLKNVIWEKVKKFLKWNISYPHWVLCSYTQWANGRNNVMSSQSTLIWKDWDIFYLWRRDINLYLKNVVLASLYFSLEYLEEQRSINHIL